MILTPDSLRKKVPYFIKRKGLGLAGQTGKPNNLCTTRLGPCNVSFRYLYRDASNYKLHGEAIFTNHTFMSIDEIEKQIRSSLRDGEFFITRQVKIEERFFDILHEDDDHPWHEFDHVESTTEPVFDPKNYNQHKHKRDITEFIADLEKANRAGWDEMNVHANVVKLMEEQKRTLKQAYEIPGRGEVS